jgi:hypothetical protein
MTGFSYPCQKGEQVKNGAFQSTRVPRNRAASALSTSHSASNIFRASHCPPPACCLLSPCRLQQQFTKSTLSCGTDDTSRCYFISSLPVGASRATDRRQQYSSHSRRQTGSEAQHPFHLHYSLLLLLSVLHLFYIHCAWLWVLKFGSSRRHMQDRPLADNTSRQIVRTF